MEQDPSMFLNAKQVWSTLPNESYLCNQHKLEIITDHCDSFFTGQNQGFSYELINTDHKCDFQNCDQTATIRLVKKCLV